MKSGISILFFLIFLNSCGEKTNAQSEEILSIKFSGEFPIPFDLSLEELKAMPQIEVSGKEKDEEIHHFQGVLLIDLLKKTGLELGTGLKGKNQAQYLLVEAADGYKVVFSLPEIDPEFSGKHILVAHSRDGIPLEEGVGPFRFVVPEEKLHARWVRDVIAVKLIKID
ncbi:Sulfite oxidase and related enzymes [Aquiflexum balticum DSM 16537]|uniref:Sulfite oxidase and related enzymes n=1 Tax=Aquiflexum balticum DSM 16537 TaxID=758820 RepID=A0A1W2H154_9BACT|nr:molybdopterin-dependent oxidoreductase [Aquiflexum balticum]SMD42226.1 Sulfite oxidase and related enzymes [Aquiflexum balticum DSM 16537]